LCIRVESFRVNLVELEQHPCGGWRESHRSAVSLLKYENASVTIMSSASEAALRSIWLQCTNIPLPQHSSVTTLRLPCPHTSPSAPPLHLSFLPAMLAYTTSALAVFPSCLHAHTYTTPLHILCKTYACYVHIYHCPPFCGFFCICLLAGLYLTASAPLAPACHGISFVDEAVLLCCIWLFSYFVDSRCA
jgi:hypothetical protein